MLAQRGIGVTWWTSDFDHFRKLHRFGRYTAPRADGIEYRALSGWGYERNISLLRQVDHLQIARQFQKKAPLDTAPDVILASLPTIELAAAAVRYGNRRRVPVVIDVRDLWPGIFIDAAPSSLKRIAATAILPLQWAANRAFRNAAAITGSSKSFVDWGLSRAKRAAGTFDREFQFGYPALSLDSDLVERSVQQWRRLGVQDDGALTVCFFGSLTDRFDFDTLIAASKILAQQAVNVRFVVCGTGSNLEKLKSAAGDNFIVPGWIDSFQIAALMKISDVGIAPYFNGGGFNENLPNKAIEYTAGGVAVVSCLDGALAELIKEEDLGVTYRLGDPASLAEVLGQLAACPEVLRAKKNNARATFNRQFRADAVYGEMIEYLDAVAARGIEPKTS
jgi:glycosyltransferase involved in cell wall biosynthesis